MKTKKLQILGGFPQSDWNQTDETASDYIKNKPDVDGLKTELQTKIAQKTQVQIITWEADD